MNFSEPDPRSSPHQPAAPDAFAPIKNKRMSFVNVSMLRTRQKKGESSCWHRGHFFWREGVGSSFCGMERSGILKEGKLKFTKAHLRFLQKIDEDNSAMSPTEKLALA